MNVCGDIFFFTLPSIVKLLLQVPFSEEGSNCKAEETNLDKEYAEPGNWFSNGAHEFNIGNADDETQKGANAYGFPGL